MYKFTIEYYFDRYHTGKINETKTRKGVVIANDKGEAIEKINQADKCYVAIAELTFEEMVGEDK